MNTVTTFAAIFVLATLAESIVEYLVKPLLLPEEPRPDDPKPVAGDENGDGELIVIPPHTRGMLLRYVSALVGILLCIAYRADLLALVGLITTTPLVGYIITGIVIGRGANYLHDLVGRWGGGQREKRGEGAR